MSLKRLLFVLTLQLKIIFNISAIFFKFSFTKRREKHPLTCSSQATQGAAATISSQKICAGVFPLCSEPSINFSPSDSWVRASYLLNISVQVCTPINNSKRLYVLCLTNKRGKARGDIHRWKLKLQRLNHILCSPLLILRVITPVLADDSTAVHCLILWG